MLFCGNQKKFNSAEGSAESAANLAAAASHNSSTRRSCRVCSLLVFLDDATGRLMQIRPGVGRDVSAPLLS